MSGPVPKSVIKRFTHFSEHFLAALLSPDEAARVHVGKPVSPAWLDAFALASPDTNVRERIADGAHRIASAVAPVRGGTYPQRGAMAIAMACYDLLATTDPMHDRVFARGAIPKMLEYASWLLDAAGAPRTRTDALVRHAVVSSAIELRRRDVTVKTWAYTHRYFGRPVPPRVVAAPKIRMVREQHAEATAASLIGEVLAGAGKPELFAKLLSRSPVTELLTLERTRPLVFGRANLAIASDPALRGAIARRLSRSTEAPFVIGEALERLAATSPPGETLYFALALVYDMHVTRALETRTRDRDERATRRDLGEDAPRDDGDGDDASRLFHAVLAAILDRPQAFAPMLDLDDQDVARVRKRAIRLPYDRQALDRARTLVALATIGSDEPREGVPGRQLVERLARS